MKNLLTYALVGVVSAGTTFGLIEYNKSNDVSSNSVATLQPEQNGNAQFATYNYTSAGTDLPDFTKAAESSVNAVVSVTNYGTRSNRQSGGNPFGDMFSDPFFEHFFGERFRGQQRQPQSEQKEVPLTAGSGVIISKDGYIVTNNHVIQNATKVEITLNNKQNYTAKVIGTDPNTDISLLKIDEDNLPYLSFFNSDNLKVGEWVLAVGNPFGLNSTVTAGIVSAKGRSINILGKNGDHPIESFIQTDAAINPGNSGGALVNTNGHLVGINTAIFSQTGSYAGYGFAVPSNIVQKIVSDLKQYGMVQRGFLGVGILDTSDEQMVKQYNKEFDKKVKPNSGIMVSQLSDDGGAIEAGIEEGDFIKKIDGQPVTAYSNLSVAIGSKNPGDVVKVTVERNGKLRDYNVTLKDINGNAKIRSKADLTATEKMGASFQPLTDEMKARYGIKNGVMVTSISSRSDFAQIGINEGYIITKINGKDINSKNDIDKILKNYKGNVSVNFLDRYGRMYTQGFKM